MNNLNAGALVSLLVMIALICFGALAIITVQAFINAGFLIGMACIVGLLLGLMGFGAILSMFFA